MFMLLMSSLVYLTCSSPNTVCHVTTSSVDFPDNTAGIVTRRSGFQRHLQDLYVLPVVVEDSGYPAQSSTATLTIRVCACGTGGSLLTCSAEAVFLPVGLSTGALMAILLCVSLLIGKMIILLHFILTRKCLYCFFNHHLTVNPK